MSLGGDIAISDTGAAGVPWPIAISTFPGQPAETTVTLDRGGLGHLEHPRTPLDAPRRPAPPRAGPPTGLPSPTTWQTVTATGRSATAANIASTMAIVLGPAAPNWLREHGVDARLVAADGHIETIGAWPAEPDPTPDRRGA